MSKKKATKKAVKKSVTKSKAKAKAKKPTGPDVKPNKDIIVGFKTVSLTMKAWHDPNYQYTLGKEHVISFNSETEKDRGAPCGKGLHFSPTEQKTYQYTSDKNNFLVLEVHAHKDDVLGQDSEKYRVSKLKVVKVLKTVTKYGDAWQVASKEVAELGKTLLRPAKTTTHAAVKASVTAWGKAAGIRGVKCHIVENPYEASVLAENIGTPWYSNEGFSASLPTFPKFANARLSAHSFLDTAKHIASMHLTHKETSIKAYPAPAITVASVEVAFNMLKMGCLPVGYDSASKTMAVWVPTENPFTAKAPF